MDRERRFRDDRSPSPRGRTDSYIPHVGPPKADCWAPGRGGGGRGRTPSPVPLRRRSRTPPLGMRRRPDRSRSPRRRFSRSPPPQVVVRRRSRSRESHAPRRMRSRSPPTFRGVGVGGGGGGGGRERERSLSPLHSLPPRGMRPRSPREIEIRPPRPRSRSRSRDGRRISPRGLPPIRRDPRDRFRDDRDRSPPHGLRVRTPLRPVMRSPIRRQRSVSPPAHLRRSPGYRRNSRSPRRSRSPSPPPKKRGRMTSPQSRGSLRQMDISGPSSRQRSPVNLGRPRSPLPPPVRGRSPTSPFEKSPPPPPAHGPLRKRPVSPYRRSPGPTNVPRLGRSPTPSRMRSPRRVSRPVSPHLRGPSPPLPLRGPPDSRARSPPPFRHDRPGSPPMRRTSPPPRRSPMPRRSPPRGPGGYRGGPPMGPRGPPRGPMNYHGHGPFRNLSLYVGGRNIPPPRGPTSPPSARGPPTGINANSTPRSGPPSAPTGPRRFHPEPNPQNDLPRRVRDRSPPVKSSANSTNAEPGLTNGTGQVSVQNVVEGKEKERSTPASLTINDTTANIISPTNPPSGTPASAPSIPSGPSSNTPHGIPTGPRAGNYPYRSSITLNNVRNNVNHTSNHINHNAHGNHHSTVTTTTTTTTTAVTASATALPNGGMSSLNAPTGTTGVIPGGRLMPSQIPSENLEKLARLKADQAKLEEELKVLQARKRRGLAMWERAERESAREAYRVELADNALNTACDGY